MTKGPKEIVASVQEYALCYNSKFPSTPIHTTKKASGREVSLNVSDLFMLLELASEAFEARDMVYSESHPEFRRAHGED